MAQNTTASNTQQEKNPQSDGTIIYIPPVLFRPFGTDKTDVTPFSWTVYGLGFRQFS